MSTRGELRGDVACGEVYSKYASRGLCPSTGPEDNVDQTGLSALEEVRLADEGVWIFEGVRHPEG